jgi:hypothetical protein
MSTVFPEMAIQEIDAARKFPSLSGWLSGTPAAPATRAKVRIIICQTSITTHTGLCRYIQVIYKKDE